jgi:recombinational DNA repair ATPase RecF
MRIRSVRAVGGFGCLNGEQLELAEGMTVITGPNESGKSTWHAAIYAALCGMRRGRGRRSGDCIEFADRHRPWSGDEWRVGAVIELDDGRTVETHHDLDGLVDCQATLVGMGRDVSGEILFEGTPDASRWLGLNRRTFLSVASIRQAEILRVIDDAGSLQKDLQRAASTAGSDQSAAGAIEIIDGALREQVGVDRGNSTKPLRRAKEHLASARSEAERVQSLHEKWQSDLEVLSDLRNCSSEARTMLCVAEAAKAARDLDEMSRQLSEVRRLRFPDSAPLTEPVNPALSDADSRGSGPGAGHEPEAGGPEAGQGSAVGHEPSLLPAPEETQLSPTGPAVAMALVGLGLIVSGIALRNSGSAALGTTMGLVLAGLTVAALGAQLASSRRSRRSPSIEAEVARLERRWQVEEQARHAEEEARHATSRAELDCRLEDLESRFEQAHALFDELSSGVDEQSLANWTWEDEPDRKLARLRADSTRLDRALAVAEREVQVRAEGVSSVAEALEALTAAEAGLARIELLGDDLNTARHYLQLAKDRTNRDIAPRLAEELGRRLDQVTAGRYVEVRVDPEDLEVRVRDAGGHWRTARQLSTGTAEQVYLLLRIVMADMLSAAGTSCPLILDDVFVQCDHLRTRALLEMLFDESAHRQVIVLSQEDDVASWARERLSGTRDHHIELTAHATPLPTQRAAYLLN